MLIVIDAILTNTLQCNKIIIYVLSFQPDESVKITLPFLFNKIFSFKRCNSSGT